MTVQIRNDQQVDLLSGDFFPRYEPNAAMVHAASVKQQQVALRAYWPCSAKIITAQSVFVTDQGGGGFHFPAFNAPTHASQGLFPYVGFASASSQYLSIADNAQFDITGTETSVAAGFKGLTISFWVYFTEVGGAASIGLVSKWQTALPNQKSYRVIRLPANNIQFDVTTDGSTIVSVTSTGTVAASTWYHIWARFVPSTTMTIAIDNSPTPLAAGVPASIYNSSAALEAARTDGAGYLDGRLSQISICASAALDVTMMTEYEQTRAWIGK